jgi:putative transposase
VSVWN